MPVNQRDYCVFLVHGNTLLIADSPLLDIGSFGAFVDQKFSESLSAGITTGGEPGTLFGVQIKCGREFQEVLCLGISSPHGVAFNRYDARTVCLSAYIGSSSMAVEVRLSDLQTVQFDVQFGDVVPSV